MRREIHEKHYDIGFMLLTVFGLAIGFWFKELGADSVIPFSETKTMHPRGLVSIGL